MKRSRYFSDEPERITAIRDIESRSPELRDAMVAAETTGKTEPVLLRCPRGHALRTVMLSVYHHDGHGYPRLDPLRARTGSARVVASDASPRAPRPCAEPGCPTLNYEASCPEHGGAADETDAWLVRFACRRCKYVGTYKQESLLRLYAVALRLGGAEIRLPT